MGGGARPPRNGELRGPLEAPAGRQNHGQSSFVVGNMFFSRLILSFMMVITHNRNEKEETKMLMNLTLTCEI